MTQAPSRLLMVDDLVPDSRLGYGYSRSRAAIETLGSLGARITFFPLWDPELREPATGGLTDLGVEVVRRKRRWRRRPLSLQGYWSSQGHRFSTLWVSRPANLHRVLRALDRTQRPRALVYDAEAISARREALRLRLLGTPWTPEEERHRLEQEIDMIRRADLVLTVSLEEDALLAERGVSHRYRLVCPVGARVTPRSFERRSGALFVGSFLNLQCPSPNLDAAAFMLKEVAPRLGSVPSLQVTIAGHNSKALLVPPHEIAIAPEISDRVEIAGAREDLTDLYDRARVFVAPTRFGAGISLKVYEAMSRGVPCVVSPLIARQMEASEGALLVADGAGAFAEAIVRCHEDRDLWHRLRERGAHYVETHASPAAFDTTLRAVLQELARRGADVAG